MDGIPIHLLASRLLTWVVSAFVVGVVVLVWKEAVKGAADTVVAWGKSFLSMPKSLNAIAAQVTELDTRMVSFEKKIGNNGTESVFDMLHVLQDGIAANIARERLHADREGAKMWHADSRGHCIWASKGLQELVGSTFDERFRGMNWLTLFNSDDRYEIGIAWARAINNRDPFVYSARYVHSDGYDIPVRLEAYPLPDGAVVGMVTRLHPVVKSAKTAEHYAAAD